MKLQEQVTSVKISNRLHELEVRTPSLFFRDSTRSEEYQIDRWGGTEGGYCLDNVNCYTSSELGEMLPESVKNNSALLYIWKDDANQWRVDYSRWGMAKIGYMIEKENTIANAMGKMLIYLLENKLIPTPNIKQ